MDFLGVLLNYIRSICMNYLLLPIKRSASMGAVIEFVMPKFNFMKIMSKKFNGEVEHLSLQYTVSQKGINRWDLYHYPKISTYEITYTKK